ncbi:hypothetical protein V8E36_000034 [Tilletia maclaganii]
MCDSTPDPKILSLATISTNPKPSQQVAINTTVYQRPGAMSGSSQRDPPSSFLALSPPHPSSSQPPSLTAAELDACAGYRRLPQAALVRRALY